jgi:hypothetical protein
MCRTSLTSLPAADSVVLACLASNSLDAARKHLCLYSGRTRSVGLKVSWRSVQHTVFEALFSFYRLEPVSFALPTRRRVMLSTLHLNITNVAFAHCHEDHLDNDQRRYHNHACDFSRSKSTRSLASLTIALLPVVNTQS